MKIRSIVFTLLISLVLTACSVSHKSYKTDSPIGLEPGTIDCSDPDKISSLYLLDSEVCKKPGVGKYKFGVIEFDDVGEFWNRNQLVEISKAVKESAQAKRTVFVLFVHGWRHNASEGSSNLRDFRQFIQDLSSEACGYIWEGASNDCDKRNVVGVYLSWRGDPLGLTAGTSSGVARTPQLVTVSNRKRVARLAATTNATHTILTLLQALESGDTERRNEKIDSKDKEYKSVSEQRSKKFLVGHSFGARFLEHAMAQSFLGRKHLSKELGVTEKLLKAEEFVKRFTGSADILRNTYKRLPENFKDLNQEIWSQDKYILSESSSIGKKEVDIEKSGKAAKAKGKSRAKLLEFLVDAETGILAEWSSSLEKVSSAVKIWACVAAAKYDNAMAQQSIDSEFSGAANAIPQEPDESSASSQLNLEALKECDSSSNKLEFADKNEAESYKSIVKIQNRLIKDIRVKRTEISTMLASKSTNIKTISSLVTTTRSLLNSIDQDASELLKKVWEGFGNDSRLLANKIASGNKKVMDGVEKITLVYEGSELSSEEIVEEIEKINRELGVLSDTNEKSRKSLAIRKGNLDQRKQEITKTKGDLENTRESVLSLWDVIQTQFEFVEEVIKDLELTMEKTLFPPADLVLLVNPATEALFAQMLINTMCDDADYRKTMERYNLKREPWIISIKSDGDQSTGKVFKALSTVSKYGVPTRAWPRNYKKEKRTSVEFQLESGEVKLCKHLKAAHQKDVLTATAPGNVLFHSHRLYDVSEIGSSGLEVEQYGCVLENLSNEKNKQSETLLDGLKQSITLSKGIQRTKECQAIALYHSDQGLILAENNDVQSQNNPIFSDYWIFSVPKSLVKDHNDIFNSGFGKLLGGLISREDPRNCLSTDGANQQKNNRYCDLLANFKLAKSVMSDLSDELILKATHQ